MLRRSLVLSLLVSLAACGSQASTTTRVPLKENLSFTGKLIGSMSAGTPGSACGATKGGYSAAWSGTVLGLAKNPALGSPWTVSFSITHYHGPATYTMVEQVHSGDASLTSGGKKTYVLIFGTVTINKDEHSGSFQNVELAQVGESVLAAAVVMDGNWKCV